MYDGQSVTLLPHPPQLASAKGAKRHNAMTQTRPLIFISHHGITLSSKVLPLSSVVPSASKDHGRCNRG